MNRLLIGLLFQSILLFGAESVNKKVKTQYIPIIMDDIIVFVEKGVSILNPVIPPVADAKKYLKKTGQTIIYASKDDGYYEKGVTPSYTRDNVNKIVKDNITGLQWADDADVANSSMKKRWLTTTNHDICRGLNGQTQDTAKCTDTSGDTVATYCYNLTLGGHTDWRLPTRKELVGLSDYGRINPAINPIFVNTASSYYWSSTTDAYYSFNAWLVTFYSGDQNAFNKIYGNYVRCVRAG